MIPADTNRTIKEEYKILLHELQEYNPELIHKPRVLAITKTDLLDDELQAEMKKDLPSDIPSIFISSVAQKNIDDLKDILWKEINK
jgi:GTP-binding protein